jgi:hypothetical protein
MKLNDLVPNKVHCIEINCLDDCDYYYVIKIGDKVIQLIDIYTYCYDGDHDYVDIEIMEFEEFDNTEEHLYLAKMIPMTSLLYLSHLQFVKKYGNKSDIEYFKSLEPYFVD